jgi:SOS-response transcriptional repressor LexA
MIGRHILDGDLVVLERGPDPRHGQVVAALLDGERTLNRLLKYCVLAGTTRELSNENSVQSSH